MPYIFPFLIFFPLAVPASVFSFLLYCCCCCCCCFCCFCCYCGCCCFCLLSPASSLSLNFCTFINLVKRFHCCACISAVVCVFACPWVCLYWFALVSAWHVLFPNTSTSTTPLTPIPQPRTPWPSKWVCLLVVLLVSFHFPSTGSGPCRRSRRCSGHLCDSCCMIRFNLFNCNWYFRKIRQLCLFLSNFFVVVPRLLHPFIS